MRFPGRRGNCRKFNGLGLKEWRFEVPAIPVGTWPRSWAQTPVPLSGAVEFRGGRGKVLGGAMASDLAPRAGGWWGSLPAVLGPRRMPRFSGSPFRKLVPSRVGRSSP